MGNVSETRRNYFEILTNKIANCGNLTNKIAWFDENHIEFNIPRAFLGEGKLQKMVFSFPSPSLYPQGILFTAVVLCMDDDLLVPPSDAPIGELVTVKGHPPTPSRNPQAVSVIWEKVLQEELLTVGDDEVSRRLLAGVRGFA